MIYFGTVSIPASRYKRLILHISYVEKGAKLHNGTGVVSGQRGHFTTPPLCNMVGEQTMSNDTFGLPRDLGDGLLLRWATAADADDLAEFNIRIHSDSPDNPETELGDWTRDLLNGRHPTTSSADFTVVVDTNNGNKIISSLCLISQTWTYGDIPFGVGRPELVGTDENYRRRRLVRQQFDVIHAKSAAKGELAQAITGIPWYYRLFGY
jgi:hypothetical protein